MNGVFDLSVEGFGVDRTGSKLASIAEILRT